MEDDSKYSDAECPECDGLNIIRKGFRYTKVFGKTQRFKCKDCGTSWSNRCYAFLYPRYQKLNYDQVELIFQLKNKGYSSRKISNLIGVSHQTALNAVKTFRTHFGDILDDI